MGAGERFESLYRMHARAVRAYVLRRSGEDEGDDVVAEVFLVAWRRLDDVPVDGLPWLLGVARRVLADRRRRQSREIALKARLVAEDIAPVEWPLADPDDRVLRLLSTLPPADQEVLLLVAWEELEPARAAAVIGVRAGTFAMRLHRARRRFARALAADAARTEDPAMEPELPEVLR
jgi:RNA polymerase sigma-70 factor, ECF subfamily